MCLFNFMASLILLLTLLLLHAIAFLGFCVIAFGISLIVFLIIQINNGHSINTTYWAVGGLIILSHLSEGFLLLRAKSEIQLWLEAKKLKYPNMLFKLPVLIYFILTCIAIYETFLQHHLQNPSNNTNMKTNNSIMKEQQKIVTKKGSPLIFLFSMAFIVYIVAGSSDWITYFVKPNRIPQHFNIPRFFDYLTCMFKEFVNTFCNPLLLLVYAAPFGLDYFGISPIWIMVTGIFGVLSAAYVKADKFCCQLGFSSPSSPGKDEIKLFAKIYLLEHLWFPLVVFWFMKDWKIRPMYFPFELSDRQDFAIWLTIFLVAFYKSIRNITVCPDSDLLRVRNNRVGVAEEPFGGGDNSHVKVREPSRPRRQQPPQNSIEPSRTINRENIADNNDNNNNNNYIVPFVNVPDIQPSAPTFYEINESEGETTSTCSTLPPNYYEAAFGTGLYPNVN